MAAKTPKHEEAATMLMPITVDVDLIRFEKNLLQIGFFGANDARDKGRASRRIEQVVFRNGNKIKVAAEFRGSESLGLPSTTDRDKFIALLKIIGEQRAKTGTIQNPIRFSGYRLIQELGLSRNGEIYEEILRWGKRMTDTTITSEHVVYRAAKKVYSDEVLHVFRSFRRTGSSNLYGADRQEHYEVVLEDWLLENLNQRYVIPEDFNAYKQLTRPTAKGIFGNLYLWFHASQGRPVEKDYAELCNLLNVQAYPHLSKIRSTMGLSLNELVAIKYLSKWDVQKMTSKAGYKIVMMPGDELLAVLGNTRAERRGDGAVTVQGTKQLPAGDVQTAALTVEAVAAVDLLKLQGVLPAKARELVEAHGAATVTDVLEYLQTEVLQAKRKTIENPAGLIVYSIENGLPVPAGFQSSRQRKEAQEREQRRRNHAQSQADQEYAYGVWVEQQQDRVVREMFGERELERRTEETLRRLTKADDRLKRLPEKARRDMAYRALRREVNAEVMLPSMEEWRASSEQAVLFG